MLDSETRAAECGEQEKRHCKKPYREVNSRASRQVRAPLRGYSGCFSIAPNAQRSRCGKCRPARLMGWCSLLTIAGEQLGKIDRPVTETFEQRWRRHRRRRPRRNEFRLQRRITLDVVMSSRICRDSA